MDDDEGVLNSLVSKAVELHKYDKNGFTSLLSTWMWDGEYFMHCCKYFIKLYITGCSDCTTRMLHMPKPAKPSLSQNEVGVLKLKLC